MQFETIKKLKIKRLGRYRYSLVEDGGKLLGLVSVCRSGNRTQWYQVQLQDGTVLKEFTSVRKAAEAAQTHLV